jgi:hypothetical protein
MQKSVAKKSVMPRMVLLAVMLMSVSAPALAYIDPGTGSMLLQMGMAAIAGALFYFRQFRMMLVDWFRRSVLRQSPDASATSTNPPSSETTL